MAWTEVAAMITMTVTIVVVVKSAVTAVTTAITWRTEALACCLNAVSGCLKESGDQEETVLADPAMVAARAMHAGLEGLRTAKESSY